ncbi:MAG: poly-beta-1,6-N-acetyl-D-glucosamine N-deacetylase PgaB [Gammaproteobacteria bacterium]|nr:poly-beta-1,6-N-acetyl-D-glucosamine N-deacetylase PgaB [Gammaproteobacteria bacterium]
MNISKTIKTYFPCQKLNPLWVALLLLAITTPAYAELIVLSYHEADHKLDNHSDFDAMTLKTSELAAQFSWLKEQGYVSINIDDLLAAQKGTRTLPDNAVLLSFDDGYLGMYTQVYPLLRAFDFQAVIAVVGRWMETPNGKKVAYGTKSVARENFLTWAQIREMVKSGRVEIASHSYDLHHGILANPQGNTQPAATSQRYNANASQYENEKQYRQRIYNDLKRNSDLITRKTGKKPRVLVWPYGAHNRITMDIAQKLGMPVTLSLEEGRVDLQSPGSINRLLIGHGITLADFVWQITNHYKPQKELMRAVNLNLDDIYAPDPEQQEKNLGEMLEKIKKHRINTVYLQAFSDPGSDGNADAVYFPNRHLPVRTDLFNRATWQLRTRTEVKVYAWMPPEAFRSETVNLLGDLYEDLARYSYIDGLAFYHAASLSDNEHELIERALLYRPLLKVTHKKAEVPSMSILEKN